MARILITGSADGLGRTAAELLIEQGHRVVPHARNEQRAEAAMARLSARKRWSPAIYPA
jgi:NAD(P)-dependent dehydrogenase (short-subunit alcohol dehydrogenase family)